MEHEGLISPCGNAGSSASSISCRRLEGEGGICTFSTPYQMPNPSRASRRKRRQVPTASIASARIADEPGYRARIAQPVRTFIRGSSIAHNGCTATLSESSTGKSCVFGNAIPASVSRAFRYFSTHCCEWKQMGSYRLRLRDRSRSVTTS